MPEKFIYRIIGFLPSENDMGAYGFNVIVDAGLARKAFQKPLPEAGYQNITKMAEGVIRRIGLSRGEYRIKPPYRFAENPELQGGLSCLLQACEVPGDACHLSLDWNQMEGLKRNMERTLHFDPHNVDTHLQAYALLSNWLKWADLVEAFFSD